MNPCILGFISWRLLYKLPCLLIHTKDHWRQINVLIILIKDNSRQIGNHTLHCIKQRLHKTFLHISSYLKDVSLFVMIQCCVHCQISFQCQDSFNWCYDPFWTTMRWHFYHYITLFAFPRFDDSVDIRQQIECLKTSSCCNFMTGINCDITVASWGNSEQ